MDLKVVHSMLDQLAEEKGISKEKVLETIEMALAAAYKKDYGRKSQIIRAELDAATGAVIFSQIKIVVDETLVKTEEEIEAEEETHTEEDPTKQDEALRRSGRKNKEYEMEDLPKEGEEKRIRFNAERHIMLSDARAIKKDAELHDELVFPLETHDDYGRIAAQTAKQVIIQRIREAEREAVFDEFQDREGEIISGIVQRIEGKNVYVDLGRTTALLAPEEQVVQERYRIGERMKALLFSVDREAKGPSLRLSRSHPRFVMKLFELEVPEIANGAVEIKAIAREAGARSKIAVVSHEDGVDPVGSCVGQKGVRVSTVIAELGGEKIDIIEWDEDPMRFISNAVAPAKALEVILSEEERSAKVMVGGDQLSLAIGKGGQNVRLAAKLTGWKIDVRSKDGSSPEDVFVGEADEEDDISLASDSTEDPDDSSEEEKE